MHCRATYQELGPVLADQLSVLIHGYISVNNFKKHPHIIHYDRDIDGVKQQPMKMKLGIHILFNEHTK